jgi:hypothetical protein
MPVIAGARTSSKEWSLSELVVVRGSPERDRGPGTADG